MHSTPWILGLFLLPAMGGCQKKQAATDTPASANATATAVATVVPSTTPSPIPTPATPVPTVVSTEPCEWPLRDTGVLDAWALQAANAKTPGEGVIIGLPDTGYLPHPEILYGNQINQGLWLPHIPNSGLPPDIRLDLVGDRSDPSNLDRSGQQSLLARDFGHGTRVASVIMSPIGRHPASEAPDVVSGVAYGARILPIKVAESELLANVVLPNTKYDNPLILAEGIRLATKSGAAVISVSLVAPPNLGDGEGTALRQAVTEATRAGAIVVASVGESISSDVTVLPVPAAYPEAISVAATGPDSRPWNKINPNQDIEISAPGYQVCVADCYWKSSLNIPAESIPIVGDILGDVFGQDGGLNINILNKNMGFRVKKMETQASAYATGFVAGVAALWVSHHGWENLKTRYGSAKVHQAFRLLMRQTSTIPEGWPSGYGSGIIHAGNLLKAPLPASEHLP